ncbi:hypothetical protein [Oceanospirillum sediminis]|uniref:Uncharacterized protein n=1 Tax=Oceanospirillum sediminis TaxID=2760088 RepID=A0A839IQX0_9GAMM|nr:hypothetical protein [Oceanospirillum sediminis]MBB1487321.1 hypothetical protein [Oceanospirillum sediminis]
MRAHTDKSKENKNYSMVVGCSRAKRSDSNFQFIDNRPEAMQMKRFQEMANNSRQVKQLRAFPKNTGNSPNINQNTISPIIQRQIFQNSDGKYYSDMEPDRYFDTWQEAYTYEQNMEAPPPISGGRPPSLFTHTSTKSTNKISSYGIPQGPHTVAHAALMKALYNAEGRIDTLSVIAEQIPNPSQWRDLVNNELGGGNHFHGKSEFSQRLLRAYRHYNGLYQGLLRSLNDKNEGTPFDWMHELIQLHPYAVYGWASPKTIKKKHLKGKGETGDLSDTKRNIDTLANFKNRESYYEAIADRLELLDPDYEDNSEQYSDSEDDAMSIEDDLDSLVETEQENKYTFELPELDTSISSKRLERRLLLEVLGCDLLFQNNCLINAIAMGAGITVSYEQLVEIRVRIGSIGNMLFASPNTVGIILNVLGINAGVLVHYPVSVGQDNEPIGNQNGLVIHVYHTGGDHFVSECPNPADYF